MPSLICCVEQFPGKLYIDVTCHLYWCVKIKSIGFSRAFHSRRGRSGCLFTFLKIMGIQLVSLQWCPYVRRNILNDYTPTYVSNGTLWPHITISKEFFILVRIFLGNCWRRAFLIGTNLMPCWAQLSFFPSLKGICRSVTRKLFEPKSNLIIADSLILNNCISE